MERNNNHSIFQFIFTLLILVFVIYVVNQFYLAFNPYGEKKLFEIKKGEGMIEIGKNLEKEGLIKNRFFFYFYVLINFSQSKLKSGLYFFSPSQSISEIAQKIITGQTAQVMLTFIEGINLKEIDEILKKNSITENLSSLKVSDFKNEFSFLNDAPDDASLEGFLFPDTYFFQPKSEKKEIARVFLKNFDQKLTENLRAEIKKQKRTIFEVVILASILEKEVRTFDEKKLVAGILLKRLENKIPLQVDATVTYITGKKTPKISLQDLKIDSPYNTYRYLGWPPGPISNPGIESLKAAIFPQQSPFWYYLSAPDGTTYFSIDFEHHKILKEKYWK